MGQVIKRIMFSIIMVMTVFLTASGAATSDRAGKWEIFFAPMWMNDIKFDGNNGSSADINGRSGVGFGFAYNINNNIEVGMLFNASSGSYTATVIDEEDEEGKYNSTMYSSSLAVSAAYNFLDGPLTPYVGVNIGSTFIDSNIPTGDEYIGCWYDPWLGYVCAGYSDTYTSTNFSYGADAGLRYDTDELFFKLGIGKNYIDASDTLDVTLYTLIFGFKF